MRLGASLRTAEAFGLADLPGPRRLIGDIRKDLAAGRSVVVVLPDAALATGLAQSLFDAIVPEVDLVVDADLAAHRERSVPEILASQYFSDPDLDDRAGGRWEAYLAHPESSAQSVLVASWICDIRYEIEHWVRIVHASTADRIDRPTFLVVALASDVRVDQLERADSDDIVVRWWWGVLGLLDSELAVEYCSDGTPPDALRRAMIAEAAGWELDLLADLASRWSGTPTDLIAALEGARTAEPWVLSPAERSALTVNPNRLRPPEVLRAAWSAGRVQLWNDMHYVSLTVDTRVDFLQRRFWSAQARVLMPMLERARSSFEIEFRKRATTAVIGETLSGGYARSDSVNVLEIGRMAGAHRSRRVQLTRYQQLTELVRIRNEIAHSQPLDGDLYRKAAAFLAGGEFARPGQRD